MVLRIRITFKSPTAVLATVSIGCSMEYSRRCSFASSLSAVPRIRRRIKLLWQPSYARALPIRGSACISTCCMHEVTPARLCDSAAPCMS